MNNDTMALKKITSFWQVFRIVFVIFSLYLMGDALYRWSGFRYYASFSEFVPSVALVTILWSFIAALTTLVVWLPLRVLEWLCLRLAWKIRMEYLLFFFLIFVLLGASLWMVGNAFWESNLRFGKILVWKLTHVYGKATFLILTLVAIMLSWLCRHKVGQWMNLIQERISPLVWLFGIITILSLPIVVYQAWGKPSKKIEINKFVRSYKADDSRPNVILITFDALTSLNMSVYGYSVQTTPFIAEWAKNASVFTKTKADSTSTKPTIASLMTSKRVWTHQRYHTVGPSMPVKSDIENLPLVLKNNGYYNMAFIANPFASVKALGISKSFDIDYPPIAFKTPNSLLEDIDFILYGLFGGKINLYDWIVQRNFILSPLLVYISRDFYETVVPPAKVFNMFLSVMDEKPPEPFFAWIHLLPPHDPYLPPEPYIGMFLSSPELRTFKTQDQALKIIIQYQRMKSANLLREVKPIVENFRARYDEFIRYCDKQFYDFITELTKRNKLKNTVVILSSDHGEMFKPMRVGHGGPPYEPVTNIPLIIKEPGQIEGRVIDDIVEQIDIPATILDLVDIAVPSWMEGRSLLPLMRDKGLLSIPAFSMNFPRNPSRGHQITKGTVAVWEGDYKLIRYLEKKQSLLFNLKQDPDELENLFDKETETGQRLLSLIKDNLKKANERIAMGE